MFVKILLSNSVEVKMNKYLSTERLQNGKSPSWFSRREFYARTFWLGDHFVYTHETWFCRFQEEIHFLSYGEFLLQVGRAHGKRVSFRKTFHNYLSIEVYNYCKLLRNHNLWSIEFMALRGLSNKVTSTYGVKQGCPLFPTLLRLSSMDIMLHRLGGLVLSEHSFYEWKILQWQT